MSLNLGSYVSIYVSLWLYIISAHTKAVVFTNEAIFLSMRKTCFVELKFICVKGQKTVVIELSKLSVGRFSRSRRQKKPKYLKAKESYHFLRKVFEEQENAFDLD